MRIRSLQIDKFGTWQSLRISRLEEGVNLFYGSNETGKTTLMQFIRMVFYGFNAQRLAYMDADFPELCGGEMELVTQTEDGSPETLHVVRHAVGYLADEAAPYQEKDLPFYAQSDFKSRFLTRTFEDGLELTNEAGERVDAFVLRSLLEGGDFPVLSGSTPASLSSALAKPDETLFTNVFSVGLQELQQLSALDSTEAAARLYQLSTGVERHSLLRILRRLEEARYELLRPNDQMAALRSSEAGMPQRGRRGWILRLIQQRELLLHALENVRGSNAAYARVFREKTALDAQIAEAEEELRQKKHQLRTYELADLLRDTWKKRGEIDEQIVTFTAEAGLTETAEASETATTALRETEAKLQKNHQTAEQLRAQLADCQTQMAALKTQHEALIGSPAFARAIPQIEAILPQEDWLETLRGRREDLRRTLRDTEAQLTMDYRRLGLDVPEFPALDEVDVSSDASSFTLTVPSLRTLQTPLRETRKLAKLVKHEKQQETDLRERADAIDAKVQAYLATRPETQTPDATGDETPLVAETAALAEPEAVRMDAGAIAKSLGTAAAALRRKELGYQQLKQACELKQTATARLDAALAAQQLPTPVLWTLGCVFVLGLTLTLFEALRLSGLFPPQSYLGSLFLFVLGTIAWFGSGFVKLAHQRKSREELASVRQSLASADEQLARLQPVIAEVTDSLSEETPLESLQAQTTQKLEALQDQLRVLQAELTTAEGFALQTSERDALLLEAKHHANRFRKLRGDFHAARQRLQSALRHLGLPISWKAKQVAALRESSDRLHELWRRHARDLEDYLQYGQEIETLTNRIQDVLITAGFSAETGEKSTAADVDFDAGIDVGNEAGIDAETDSGFDAETNEETDFGTGWESTGPLPECNAELFARLREKLHMEDDLQEQRTELYRQYQELRKTARSHKLALQKLRLQRQKSLIQVNLPNEAALPKRLEQLEKLQQLRQTRRDLQHEIDSTLEYTCPESTLWEIYERLTPPQLADRVKLLTLAVEEKQFQYNALRKQSAACETTLRQAVSDRTPQRLMYELALAEQRIVHAIHCWRTAAMTSRLVETVKRTYEQKRQPQTLEKASGFFADMTDGKYLRVWTPVAEDILYVQRQDGRTFAVEQLSSGTRELLFLAIRLALICEYQAQGLQLPLILDDVLVNLDSKRASQAAEILCQFAKDTSAQILFFTAHEHIRDLFESLDASVATLGK